MRFFDLFKKQGFDPLFDSVYYGINMYLYE